jgi:hypothetical protein
VAAEEQDVARREILIVLPRLRVVRASEDDIAAHERRLDVLAKTSKGTPVWRALEEPASAAVAAAYAT